MTGATGFIGRWVIPRLQAESHDVCALVRPTSDTTVLSRAGVLALHDDGTSDLLPTLEKYGPFDGVVHLASLFLAAHRPEDVSPLVMSNLTFPTRLIDACVRHGINWFVNTGTAWQHYDNQAYSPVNLYAATKQAFEVLARYYVEAHGLRFATLALSDTYGPNDTRQKLIELWCRIAMTGEPLDMSEGLQKIDLVYCTDVAEAFVRAVEWCAGSARHETAMPIFRVSSGNGISLRDLAVLFESITGKKLSIRWGRRPSRPREVIVPWDGGMSLPGWFPEVPVEEGLAKMWAWARTVTQKTELRNGC